MYEERLKVYGIDTSKYYQDKNFNHAKGSILDMPNCTDYDVCRGNESCEVDSPLLMFQGRPAGGFPSAENFFDDALLPKGYDLKTGSFACFENHVAYVERAITDRLCVLTDSRYDDNKSLRNDRYWRLLENITLEVGKKPNISGIGKLIGFVYLPIKDVRTIRNESYEQIEILEELVNVRKAPEGEVRIEGCYAPMGMYNVLGKSLVNNKTWYQVDTDCWICEGGWLKHYPLHDYDALVKENAELKERLKQINSLSEV